MSYYLLSRNRELSRNNGYVKTRCKLCKEDYLYHEKMNFLRIDLCQECFYMIKSSHNV